MIAWNPQANALLPEALEIVTLAERRRFLDHDCGADDPLRAQVDSLLAGHEQEGDFLDAPYPLVSAPLDDSLKPEPDDLLALDEALSELERHDPTAAELVQLRYFSVASHSYAAELLDLTRRQPDGLWVIA